MKNLLPSCLLLALAAGCLENDEEIEVRPDGSVSVALSSKGDRKDFADGYPLPLRAPWIAANDATLEWLDRVGPDTGGPETRARLAEFTAADPKADTQLAVRADFASVDRLPRWFAPESEPYRSAYLERSASLAVERRGTRTVYTFERTYHGRRFAGLDAVGLIEKHLPQELRDRIDQVADEETAPALSADEWARVAGGFTAAFVESSRAYARSALVSVYTLGDASVPPAAIEPALARTEEAVRGVVTEPRLARLWDMVLASRGAAKSEEKDAELGQALEGLERDVRDAIRDALERALVQAGVERATRNAIRARLEWSFTAFDHAGDLGDEAFSVRIAMPGTVVDGNFDELDGGRARWKFEGGDLRDRDVVLRVVSVVD